MVSSGCCELRSIALADVNALGSKGPASGGHGRLYIGRLPDNIEP
jgi:hypothetical protein